MDNNEELGFKERPQQTPAGAMMQTIMVLFMVTIFACWLATEYTAWKLAFQPALGPPLFSTPGGALKVYSPFDFFLWLIQFGHVDGTEEAFKGGEWILFSLHFLFVPAIWLTVRRAKKFAQHKNNLHGSARWADKEDIHNATLLPRPVSTAAKAFHAAVDGVPGLEAVARKYMGDKPKWGAAGCYVGAWVDPESGQYHYLTHDGPEHILAFAPTRSGKGVGLVLPTLLSWPHSALIHDIKGEAWALTAGYRRARGQKVMKFHPSALDGSSVRFNPLEEIRLRTMREVADAQNIAQMIVDPDGKGMDDHWAKTGHELLSAAILHILYTARDGARTLRGLVSFFCDPTMTIEQVAESMLNTEHDPEGKLGWIDPIKGTLTKVHPVVAESARSFLNKADNERSGVQSTAMSFLSLYRDPVVAMNTAVSEFKVRDLMNHDSPVSLYLVVPPNDMSRLRPLIRLVVNLIVRLNTEEMGFEDGRSVASYKHRMLLMLDEFPALGKLELIEEALAFIAGYGMKCYLITQDLTQLYKAYSKDESIISNAHIRIAYAPNKVETAELLSKYTGTATVTTQQRSYSGNRLNPLLMHVMSAENQQARPLLTVDECLRLRAPLKSPDGKNIIAPGDMLILPAGSNPIRGTQILYFKDPVFNGRAKIRAPRESDRLYIRGVDQKPIACDPALARIAVATRKAPELEGMLTVDEQSNQFLQQPEATAQAGAVSPAATPQAEAPVPAASTPAESAPVPTASVAPMVAAAAAVAVAAAGVEAAAVAEVEPAAPIEYTPEQLAAMDSEAEEEAGGQAQVEAAMLAEAAPAEAPVEADQPAFTSSFADAPAFADSPGGPDGPDDMDGPDDDGPGM